MTQKENWLLNQENKKKLPSDRFEVLINLMSCEYFLLTETFQGITVWFKGRNFCLPVSQFNLACGITGRTPLASQFVNEKDGRIFRNRK